MTPFGLLFQNHRVASVTQLTGLRILALAANVATGTLTARVLGPQDRGVQSAVGVAPLTLIGLFSLGMPASLIFNSKSDPQHERELFSCALLIGAASGLLGMAIGWAFTPTFLEKYDPATIFGAQLLLVVVPVSVISNVLAAALESHGKFGVVSRLQLLICLLTLLVLALLWAVHLLTPLTAASAYLLPTVPACVFLWFQARRVCKPAARFDVAHLRRMLLYGLRFYGIEVPRTIGSYLDQFILVLFLPPHDVGIYAVALSAARILNVIPTSIMSVLFPTVAGRAKDAIVEIVGVTVRVSIIFIGVGAVGLALLAPYVLGLLYGARFDGAIAPFRLLLAYMVVINLVIMQYQVFSAVGRPEIVGVFALIGLAASAVCMLILVPLMGVLGAALSLLIAALLQLVCVLAAIPLLLEMPVPRLILNGADIRRVLGPRVKQGGDEAAVAPAPCVTNPIE